MNRVVNGMKTSDGPCLSSAGVLACEFGRCLVARRGTRRGAPQTRSPYRCATPCSDAHSDRQIAPPRVSAACKSSRIFPEIPALFFAASAPELFSQLICNKRLAFLVLQLLNAAYRSRGRVLLLGGGDHRRLCLCCLPLLLHQHDRELGAFADGARHAHVPA